MHNLSQAVRYADRIVVLDGRRIRYQGDTRACVASGVLESVFHVRQHQAEDNGEKFIFSLKGKGKTPCFGAALKPPFAKAFVSACGNEKRLEQILTEF